MEEELQKQQAKELVAYEAQQQYQALEQEKVHQKNLVQAEIKARKLLESVELEASMSAQQKLNSMMHKKSKQNDNGDTPGFIDRYLSKKQFVQSAMEKKAEASYQEMA